MNLRLAYFILFIFLAANSTAQNFQLQVRDSEELISFVQQKYGFNPNLVNGVELYNLYRNIKSHPYYLGEESLPGSVTISGKQYDNQLIQYDLFNQWIILEYKELSGASSRIILEPLRTDGFHIDGNTFEKLSLDENGKLFYQVLRVDGLTCYIHWKKQLVSVSTDREFAERFSDPWRSFFLEYKGTIYPFSTRRDFASVFSGETSSQAREYMRKNKIRFRKIFMWELEGLLRHISTQ